MPSIFLPGRYRHFWILLLPFLFSTATQAVEPQAGQIYQGNTEISVETLGVGFTIPAGWRGALLPNGQAFLMEPADASATLFVIADRMSAEQAFNTLQEPVPLTDTIQLTLDGTLQRQAKDFSAFYQVLFNPQLSAELRAKSADNGTSIAFFLISSAAQLPSYRPTLEQTFASLEIKTGTEASTTIAESAGAAGSTDQETWLSYLKGKHIVRFFTATGYTEEQHIWLCSNGYYVRRFDSGGFGGGASGAFQGNYDGTWTATGAGETGQLILDTSDGKAHYDLRWDYGNSRLYVDGKRWLHDENKVCN